MALCRPELDERRQHRMLWVTYFLMLVAIWAWEGSYLIIAAASRIDVACEVTFVLSRHAVPASDWEVIANFRQINTTRTTGNVTVLADGNLTQGVAAERDFATGTRHTCVYFRNRRALYYDPTLRPLRATPSVVVHIIVFAFLCVIIVITALHMRHFLNAPAKPASVLASHTDGTWMNPFPDVELESFHGDDDDDIVLFRPEGEPQNTAVLT